jgi:hypothetical protein
MSDPIEERLGRLTPAASGLDRTALLFAAGRASARPNRPWQALAGALAALQVATLVFLWPHPEAAPNSGPGPAPRVVDVAPPPRPPAEPSSFLVQRTLAIQSDGDWPLPTATDTTTQSEVSLHPFSSPPDSLLN